MYGKQNIPRRYQLDTTTKSEMFLLHLIGIIKADERMYKSKVYGERSIRSGCVSHNHSTHSIVYTISIREITHRMLIQLHCKSCKEIYIISTYTLF